MNKIITITILCLMAIGAFAQSTNTYEYDNLNRLTKVTYANGVVVQYTYDEVGNRLTKTVAGVSVQYTITATASPTAGGTVSGAGTYDEGSSCTLTATPNTGYTFTKWTKNGSQVSTNASYTFTVTANATYVAVFTQNSYTVSASASPSAGGTVSGGGTYTHGSSCTLTATPNTGYTFTKWTKNGSQVSTSASYTFTVTANATYVAVFTQNSYTVSASASPTAGGTVSGGGTYTHGSSCTLTATPHTGYTFTKWTKNGSQVSTSASYTFTVTANASYVAVFEQSVVTTTHSQPLTNGWNWWSTYIEMEGADGLTQLENSLGADGLMIKSRSNGYVESYVYNGTVGWFGQLSSISNEQMYKISMNAAGNAMVEGSVAGTSSHPITINNGWNWIGFPLNQAVSVNDAMSGFNPSADDILKGRNSYTTFFSYGGEQMWFGTLNTLEPGCGYMYQSQGGGTKTLVFQPGRGEALAANVTPDDNVYRPQDERFADNMTVTAVVELEGKELRSDNHEVAAFVNDECRGSVRMMYVEPVDRYVAFLSVFGEQGEEVEFRLTDGTETKTSADRLSFVADGVSGTLSTPTVLRFGGASIGETASMVRIYPNPVRERGELRLQLPVKSGTVRAEVVNVLGVTVYKDSALSVADYSVRFSLPASVVPGTYVLKAMAENGTVYYGKLVVE